MDIEIRPKSIFIAFLYVILLLTVADIFSTILVFNGGSLTLIKLFDLDMEASIPSFYSASTLLLSSILLTLITIIHKRLGTTYGYWLGLAVLFLFLSLNEIASIHEKLMNPLRLLFHTSGMFHFAWVIPYSIAFLVLLVPYFRFMWNLPRKTQVLFITSGAIYISGALIMEMINSRIYENSNRQMSVAYVISTTCEELLEMLGVAVFIYALLLYISQEFNEVSITIVTRQKSLNAEK